MGTIPGSASVAMHVGYDSGTGTYLLSGGTLIADGYIVVGDDGGGTINQSGGTLTDTSTTIGGEANLGSAGTGAMYQSGGTDTETSLFLGYGSSAFGSYTLSGTGSLIVTSADHIGYYGAGTFNQSGGSHSVGFLTIGEISGASGTYLLSGGSVTIQTSAFAGGGIISAGGTGLLRISDGSMTVGGTLKVYDTGDAAPDGTAIQLLGGFLSVGSLDISANPARFNWTGGTFELADSDLTVGSGGLFGPALNLSSKTLIVPMSTTINAGAKVEAASGAMLGGSFTNSGQLSFIDGGISFSGASSSTGGATISLINSTMSLGTGASGLTNQGRINLIDSTVNGDIANSGGGAIDVAGTAIFNGSISGAAPFIGDGVKVFAGGASDVGAINTLADTIVQNGATLTAGSINEDTLTIGGTVATAPNGTNTGTSRVSSLTISGSSGNWSGKLDLANNKLIIDYGATSPLTTVRDQLHSGYNNGGWNGNGITTSMGDASHGLGYAENSVLGLSSFGGQSVDSSSILVKYTYLGDANLDGHVDVADLLLIAQHWNTSGAVWTSGDFNYDGVVNISDLKLLAQNWVAGVGNSPAPALSQMMASLGLPDVAIPEPVETLALPALVGALLKRRRIVRKSR